MNYFTLSEYFKDFEEEIGKSVYESIIESLSELSEDGINELITQNIHYQNLIIALGKSGVKQNISLDGLNEIVGNVISLKGSLVFLHFIGFVAPYYTKEFISGFIITTAGHNFYKKFTSTYGK